jgi:hypothetical protein
MLETHARIIMTGLQFVRYIILNTPLNRVAGKTVKCRDYFDTKEIYVGMATSHDNFAEDRLEDVPSFVRTECGECGRMIKLNSEGYTSLPDAKRTINWSDCRS